MAKEILLYSQIFSFTAERFIEAINAVGNENITIKINSNGGDVEDAWGMIGKIQAHKGNKFIQVDGKARSMAAFFLSYVNSSKALNTSDFVFHRAAFPEAFEADPVRFNDQSKARLSEINGHLRAAFEAKIDVQKFESISGVSMDQLFSMDTRIDVRMNAEQVKEIGLINEIVELTPGVKAEIDLNNVKIAAEYGIEIHANTPEPKKEEIIKPIDMTIEKIKAEHPALYAQIKAEGHAEGHTEGVTAGAKAEGDRIGSWLVYNKVDRKAVEAGIKSKDAITATASAEFAVKMQSPDYLKALAADAAAAANTDEVVVGAEQTEEEKAAAAFEAKLDKDKKPEKV